MHLEANGKLLHLTILKAQDLISQPRHSPYPWCSIICPGQGSFPYGASWFLTVRTEKARRYTPLVVQAEISDPALAHEGPGAGFPGCSQRSLRSWVEDESRIMATECLCLALPLSSHRKGSLVCRRGTDIVIPVVGHGEPCPFPPVQRRLHSGCFRNILWVLTHRISHPAVTPVGKARQTHGAFAPFGVEQAGI